MAKRSNEPLSTWDCNALANCVAHVLRNHPDTIDITDGLALERLLERVRNSEAVRISFTEIRLLGSEPS